MNSRPNSCQAEAEEVPSSLPIPRILLLDGGSTYLLEELLPTHPQHKELYNREFWSSSLLFSEEGNKLISKSYEDFLEAGCDLISTITYQCNYEKGVVEDEIDQALQRGVRVARQAVHNFLNNGNSDERKRRIFVVGTIGSFGASLADGSEYKGKYGISFGELQTFHTRKYLKLKNSNPDWIAFETIPCALECLSILSLLREDKNLSCPVWISFACRDGRHLNDGGLLSDALDLIWQNDVDSTLVAGVGVNCCSSENLLDLVKVIVHHEVIQSSLIRTIVFYPNRGETWDPVKECWLHESGTNCKTLSASIVRAIEYVDRATNRKISMIVGGCCRTDPKYISYIRASLNSSGII